MVSSPVGLHLQDSSHRAQRWPDRAAVDCRIPPQWDGGNLSPASAQLAVVRRYGSPTMMSSFLFLGGCWIGFVTVTRSSLTPLVFDKNPFGTKPHSPAGIASDRQLKGAGIRSYPFFGIVGIRRRQNDAVEALLVLSPALITALFGSSQSWEGIFFTASSHSSSKVLSFDICLSFLFP